MRYLKLAIVFLLFESLFFCKNDEQVNPGTKKVNNSHPQDSIHQDSLPIDSILPPLKFISFSGQVVDENLSPIPNQTVLIYHNKLVSWGELNTPIPWIPDTITATRTTNLDGFFKVDSLPNREYFLRIPNSIKNNFDSLYVTDSVLDYDSSHYVFGVRNKLLLKKIQYEDATGPRKDLFEFFYRCGKIYQVKKKGQLNGSGPPFTSGFFDPILGVPFSINEDPMNVSLFGPDPLGLTVCSYDISPKSISGWCGNYPNLDDFPSTYFVQGPRGNPILQFSSDYTGNFDSVSREFDGMINPLSLLDPYLRYSISFFDEDRLLGIGVPTWNTGNFIPLSIGPNNVTRCYNDTSEMTGVYQYNSNNLPVRVDISMDYSGQGPTNYTLYFDYQH